MTLNLNNRLAVLLVLLSGLIFATPATLANGLENDKTRSIGIGIEMNSGIYEGQDSYFYPRPFWGLQAGNFWLQEKSIGYRWLYNDSVSLSIAATMGNMWLDVSEISNKSKDLYLGIEDRDQAYEASLIFKYHSPVGLVQFDYHKDFSGAHESVRGRAKISRNIAGTRDIIAIYTGLFVNYYSAKYNQYYFGVTAEENRRASSLDNNTLESVDAFRPRYEPGNSGHVGVDLLVRYRYGKHLVINGYLAVEDLTGEWETSPLVEDKGMTTFGLGLSYPL